MQCPCNVATTAAGTGVAADGTRNRVQMNNGTMIYTNPRTGQQEKILPYIAPRPDHVDGVAAMTNGTGGTTYMQVRYEGTGTSNPCEPARQPCQRKMCVPPEKRTLCKEYGPKPSDPFRTHPLPWQQLYADAFEHDFNIGPTTDNVWNYFSNEGGFVADDGKIRTTRDGLNIISKKFVKTYRDPAARRRGSGNRKIQLCEEGFLDHFKFFAVLNSEFPVPNDGELHAEAEMAGRTFGTENHHFGNNVIEPNSDMRLAHCAFSMIDFETGVHIYWAVTNEDLYAVYEVLPIDHEDTEAGESRVRAAFAGCFQIQRRNSDEPSSDFKKLGLAIDKNRGALWYYNGNVVHTEPTIGALPKRSNMLYQIAGEAKDLDVRSVHVGFGLFTMLDAFPAEMAPVSEENRVGLVRLTNFEYRSPFRRNDKATFVVPEPREKHILFDQGASLKVKQIEVTIRS